MKKTYALGVASGIVVWWIAAEVWTYFTLGPKAIDRAVADIHVDGRLPRPHVTS